jgi:hypothetical protein
VDGIPLVVGEEVDGIDVATVTRSETPRESIEDISISFDVELDTEAIDKMAEEMAERAKKSRAFGRERELSPALHPMSRQDIRFVHEDGDPITFTGTCVKCDPPILDNGHTTAEVTDTSALMGETVRLGREFTVPAEAIEILSTGGEDR